MATSTAQQALLVLANRNGWDLEPDNGEWIHRIKIKSETSDRIYIVAYSTKQRIWGCSCPGWKSRRRCKHLTAMVPKLRELTDQRGS